MKTEFDSRIRGKERRNKEQREIPCFVDKDRRIKERRDKENRRGKIIREIEVKRKKEFKRCLDAQI